MTNETENKLRAEYGISEKDMKFDNKTESLFNIKENYETFLSNPSHLLFSNYDKEFMKNERLIYEYFLQLGTAQEEFYATLANNYYYENMDVIKDFKEILLRYKNWATYLRLQILMSREKMKDVFDCVNEKYVSIRDYENLKDEAQQIMVEEMVGEELEVKKMGNILVIPLSETKYTNGEKVKIKKLMKGGNN